MSSGWWNKVVTGLKALKEVVFVVRTLDWLRSLHWSDWL